MLQRTILQQNFYLEWDCLWGANPLQKTNQRSFSFSTTLYACQKSSTQNLSIFSVDYTKESARFHINYNGTVSWYPLFKMKTTCKLDMQFYPFDQQVCTIKLGSWAYVESKMDLHDGGTETVKHDYIENGEFILTGFQVGAHYYQLQVV